MYFPRFSIMGLTLFLLMVVITIRTVERTFFNTRLTEQQVLANLESQRRDHLADGRSDSVAEQLRTAKRQLTETTAAFRTCQEQIREWNNEIVPLLETADGSVIAGDSRLTDQLSYLFEEQRPTETEIDEQLKQVKELQQKITEHTGQKPAKRLPVDDESQIEELRLAAKDAAKVWTRAVTTAKAIQRLAVLETTETSGVEVATLRSSMRQRRDERLLEELNKERARKAAEEAEERAKQEQQAAARATLEASAQSSDVERVLAPFLAERYGQPKYSGAAVRLQSMPTLQPVSLSRLESMGALRPGEAGLKNLARIGTDRDLGPDRWMFPSQPGNWTSETRELLEQAQEMLLTLGPTLVELGRLSP